MRQHHDMGGLPAGSLDHSEHNYAPWEVRTHALMLLLSEPCRSVMTVDELRRGIETLGGQEYDKLTYYERWIASIASNLIQKGVITVDDLGRKLAEIEAREGTGGMNALFGVGDVVRVRSAYPIGHVRTPYYIRGKSGVIERMLGPFRNPEELAYGRKGEPPQPLYRVRFLQREVWPDYAGPDSDTVDIEIYQHWLEPA